METMKVFPNGRHAWIRPSNIVDAMEPTFLLRPQRPSRRHSARKSSILRGGLPFSTAWMVLAGENQTLLLKATLYLIIAAPWRVRCSALSNRHPPSVLMADATGGGRAIFGLSRIPPLIPFIVSRPMSPWNPRTWKPCYLLPERDHC